MGYKLDVSSNLKPDKAHVRSDSEEVLVTSSDMSAGNIAVISQRLRIIVPELT